jgi:hypothetical protein
VELPEHLVEQVPQRCGVSVATFPTSKVVIPGWRWTCGRCERPGVADSGEAVVLRPSAADVSGLAGGPGDRRGAGECLQSAVVGEPSPVVADLGQHDRAAGVGQAGKLVMIE